MKAVGRERGNKRIQRILAVSYPPRQRPPGHRGPWPQRQAQMCTLLTVYDGRPVDEDKRKTRRDSSTPVPTCCYDLQRVWESEQSSQSLRTHARSR
jgi:hypothetical protein